MSTLEKINALMLCDLIKHFKVESSIKPEVVEHAITSGNLWILDAEYSLLCQDEPTKEVRDFVVSVLNMYRGLSLAFRNLTSEDKEKLRGEVSFHIHEKNIQIPGFDGNNESEYVSVVEAFHAMGRFVEQVDPIANTRSSSIHSYKLMIQEYESLDPWSRANKLNVNEIRSVLSQAPLAF